MEDLVLTVDNDVIMAVLDTDFVFPVEKDVAMAVLNTDFISTAENDVKLDDDLFSLADNVGGSNDATNFCCATTVVDAGDASFPKSDVDSTSVRYKQIS